MSETGTPSKTAIASEASRLERLLGPGFAVVISLDEWNMRKWLNISACKAGHYVNWTMVEEDFKYSDDQLVEKFINPAKGVFKDV